MDTTSQDTPDTPDKSPDKSPDNVSLREAAEILGVHMRTVRRRIERGELPGEKIAGIRGEEWRIPRNALEGGHALRQPDSILTKLDELSRAIAERQRALAPTAAELEERRRRDEQLEQALTGNMVRVAEMAEELGTARSELAAALADRDEATGDRDAALERIRDLEEELAAERRMTWWQKMRRRGRDEQ